MILEPRCQQAVTAKTVYSNLSLSGMEWATKPFEVEPGERLARTMVADRPNDVTVQVVNTNLHKVKLPKGSSLGQLEVIPVAAQCDSVEATADYSHIMELINKTDESLSSDDKDNFRELLQKHSCLFSRGEEDWGCATAVKHRIDTGDSRPIRQQVRRQPPHYVAEIDRQLEEWLSQEKISPSQSEWASNIVIVKKKYGSLRFCVEYRQLNDGTVKDSYPLAVY